MKSNLNGFIRKLQPDAIIVELQLETGPVEFQFNTACELTEFPYAMYEGMPVHLTVREEGDKVIGTFKLRDLTVDELITTALLRFRIDELMGEDND